MVTHRLGQFAVFFMVWLAAPMSVLAQEGAVSPWGHHWHMWGGDMWGGGWMLWWMFPLFMMLMAVFCVAAFFFLRRSFGGFHRHGAPRTDAAFTALQILNERFARGEIQKQEFEEKRVAMLTEARRDVSARSHTEGQAK